MRKQAKTDFNLLFISDIVGYPTQEDSLQGTLLPDPYRGPDNFAFLYAGVLYDIDFVGTRNVIDVDCIGYDYILIPEDPTGERRNVAESEEPDEYIRDIMSFGGPRVAKQLKTDVPKILYWHNMDKRQKTVDYLAKECGIHAFGWRKYDFGQHSQITDYQIYIHQTIQKIEEGVRVSYRPKLNLCGLPPLKSETSETDSNLRDN